jgi:tubulin polyglutamylase TTLL6/13
MIDHKLKPWLIEVNHTPSFTDDTPFDTWLKTNVVRDSLILLNLNVEHKKKYKE